MNCEICGSPDLADKVVIETSVSRLKKKIERFSHFAVSFAEYMAHANSKPQFLVELFPKCRSTLKHSPVIKTRAYCQH